MGYSKEVGRTKQCSEEPNGWHAKSTAKLDSAPSVRRTGGLRFSCTRRIRHSTGCRLLLQHRRQLLAAGVGVLEPALSSRGGEPSVTVQPARFKSLHAGRDASSEKIATGVWSRSSSDATILSLTSMRQPIRGPRCKLVAQNYLI